MPPKKEQAEAASDAAMPLSDIICLYKPPAGVKRPKNTDGWAHGICLNAAQDIRSRSRLFAEPVITASLNPFDSTVDGVDHTMNLMASLGLPWTCNVPDLVIAAAFPPDMAAHLMRSVLAVIMETETPAWKLDGMDIKGLVAGGHAVSLRCVDMDAVDAHLPLRKVVRALALSGRDYKDDHPENWLFQILMPEGRNGVIEKKSNRMQCILPRGIPPKPPKTASAATGTGAGAGSGAGAATAAAAPIAETKAASFDPNDTGDLYREELIEALKALDSNDVLSAGVPKDKRKEFTMNLLEVWHAKQKQNETECKHKSILTDSKVPRDGFEIVDAEDLVAFKKIATEYRLKPQQNAYFHRLIRDIFAIKTEPAIWRLMVIKEACEGYFASEQGDDLARLVSFFNRAGCPGLANDAANARYAHKAVFYERFRFIDYPVPTVAELVVDDPVAGDTWGQ